MRSSSRNNQRAGSQLVDIRESPLYREAEGIFRSVLAPGSGRPVSATEPSAAPDGRQVAFTGTFLHELQGVPTGRICIADLDSGALRVVSFGPNQDLTPKFSPDGRWLAFRSDRSAGGQFQVYLLELRTGLTRATPKIGRAHV